MPPLSKRKPQSSIILRPPPLPLIWKSWKFVGHQCRWWRHLWTVDRNILCYTIYTYKHTNIDPDIKRLYGYESTKALTHIVWSWDCIWKLHRENLKITKSTLNLNKLNKNPLHTIHSKDTHISFPPDGKAWFLTRRLHILISEPSDLANKYFHYFSFAHTHDWSFSFIEVSLDSIFSSKTL